MENFSSQEGAATNPAEKKAEIKEETCDRLRTMREGMGPMEKQIVDRLFSCDPSLQNKNYVVAVQMALSQVMKTKLSLDGIYGEKTGACLGDFCQKYEQKYGEKLPVKADDQGFLEGLKRAIFDTSFSEGAAPEKLKFSLQQIDEVLAEALRPQIDKEGTLRNGHAALVNRYALAYGDRAKPNEAVSVDSSRPSFALRMAVYFPAELQLKMGRAEDLFGRSAAQMELLNKIFRASYLSTTVQSSTLSNYEDPAYREAKKYTFLSGKEQNSLADRQYAWSLKLSDSMSKALLVLNASDQAKAVQKLSSVLTDMAKIDTKLRAMELLYKGKTDSDFSSAILESHQADFLDGTLVLWNQIFENRKELARLMPSADLDAALGKMLQYQFTRLESRYGKDGAGSKISSSKAIFLKALQPKTSPDAKNGKV